MPDPRAAAAFHEVFLALAHEVSDEAFFGTLARNARALCGAETAVVALLDTPRSQLHFVGVAGPTESELRGTRVDVADSRLSRTALVGEVQLSPSDASSIAVPIFHGSVSVGALAAQVKSGGFTGDDLLALQTLAASAVVRVGAMQRRRESDATLRRLTAAEEALETVLSVDSLPAALDALCQVALEHLDADAVGLFLADDEDRSLHLAADSGLPESLRTAPLNSEGAVSDWAQTDEFAVRESVMLKRGGRVLGLLVALGRTPLEDPARHEVAAALGRQAALAIECASLREEVARRADEATTLYELSQAVSATLKVPEVLARAAEAARNRLGVEKVAVFLREPGSERLRLAHGIGLREGADARLRPLLGQGLPGWVVQFETPTASSDLATDRRDASFSLVGEGVGSLVAAPLQSGTKTVGVLCGMSARPRWFTVAEIELAYTIANQTALALENARAYAETRRQSIALRRYLQGVARAVSSPRSATPVPDVIAELTRDALGADRAALYRARTDDDGSVSVESLAAAGHRAGEPWRTTPDLDSPAAWVARKGRALCVPNLASDVRFGSKWEKPRVGAYVAVPLKTEDGTIGVLEIWRRTPSDERAADLRQLSALARHAALALEGALRRKKR